MRIVSMVPSWTETLLEAGGNVVGRTRFCIHPASRVRSIPTVGGTKNWDLSKVQAAKPNLIVLDREENPKVMGDCEIAPILATHIRGLTDLPGGLDRLAEKADLPQLKDYADRTRAMLCARPRGMTGDLKDLPAVIEWLRPPTAPIRKVIYLIWKDPWMAATRRTFIGSMLEMFLDPQILFDAETAYPKIELEKFDPQSTLLLFSSEPFPFGRKKEEITALGFPSALVDGESWSWFGIRSLRFLESHL